MTGENCGGGCVIRGVANLTYVCAVTLFMLVIAVVKSCLSEGKTIRELPDGKKKKTVAFFHPYCNEGGGSERVLWAGLHALQQTFPNHHFVIYSGDHRASSEEILVKARNNFNININRSNVEFVFLKRRKWAEASPYPILSFFGQTIGSLYLGLEALSQFTPDVYLDTLGYAFTYPLFRYLGGSRVGAYVHYPIVDSATFEPVAVNTTPTTETGLTVMELIYYRLFALVYCMLGKCCEVAMVNSSWTENHILKLWKLSGSTYKVYPPCNVEELAKLTRNPDEDDEGGTVNLISVSLFRPEKNHALQIRAMKVLKSLVKPDMWAKLRLKFLGSVRDKEDEQRIENLKQLAQELGVDENITVKTDFSFSILKDEMVNAHIGLHSMDEEHFGISVVENMAAGLLMVAHKSGGPLMDIVVTSPESNRNGFLAETEEEYAQVIKSILDMAKEDRTDIRLRARQFTNQFSEKEFSIKFADALRTILE